MDGAAAGGFQVVLEDAIEIERIIKLTFADYETNSCSFILLKSTLQNDMTTELTGLNY